MWSLLRLFLWAAPFTAPLAFAVIWYAAIYNIGALKNPDTEGRYLAGFAASLVPAWWFFMGLSYRNQCIQKWDSDPTLRWKYLASLGWSLAILSTILSGR